METTMIQGVDHLRGLGFRIQGVDHLRLRAPKALGFRV